MQDVPTDLERLYREHRAGLVRLVERELRDHHDAEDVVQTAFLDAQRALARGTIPQNPHAWLATIALNAGRRLRQRRHNAEPLEDYAVQAGSGVSEIRTALANLPREQRAAVLYRDVLGFSYGETAEQMGTSVNAVTMLLHRGRKRLREMLGMTTGGFWPWRWLTRSGVPTAAAAKGTAAVVAAAGLATAGLVAATAVAPIRANAAAASTTQSSTFAAAGAQTPGGRSARKPAPLHSAPIERPSASSDHGATQDSPAYVTSPTTAAPAQSPPSSILRVPPILRSTVRVPTLPVAVAATVTVNTPVTSITVTTPTGITVTTPLTTVTVPLP